MSNEYKELIQSSMAKVKVKLTFREPLLGTTSGNPKIAEEFISAKHPEGISEDELEAQERLSDVIDKQTTGFPRNKDGNPFLWDYQMKGFFKDACQMLQRANSPMPKMKAFRKIIDGLVFVAPRQIPIELSGEITKIQRPIRVHTPQGERVALACSECVPADSSISFEVYVLDKALLEAVKYWLAYGELRGLGQWRNSGMGRFTCEIVQ